MVGVNASKVCLGQANGPDVELFVTGTELYATYETVGGYPAVYDEPKGLFCYAKIANGQYESTGVPVTEAPPAGVERHARESKDVRARKIEERRAQLESRRPTGRRDIAPKE
jgi:hypothetical protein